MSCPVEISHAGTALNPLSLFTLLTSITTHTQVHPLLFRHGTSEFSLDFHPSLAVFTPNQLETRTKYPSSFCHFQGGWEGLRAWLSVCDPEQMEMILHAPNASFELRHDNVSFRLESEDHDSCVLLLNHVGKRGTLDIPDNFLHKQYLPAYYMEYAGILARKRYVEFALFADYSLFANYGHSRARTVNRMLDVLHMANSFFDSLNIELRLVHLEIFTSESYANINRGNEHEIMDSFVAFLKKKYQTGRVVHFDIAHLIIGAKLSGTKFTGYARYIGSICDPQDATRSVSWNMDFNEHLTNVAGILAHEIGHTLGMQHDNEGEYPFCDCPMATCLMYPNIFRKVHSSGPQYWSNCSLVQLNKMHLAGLHNCLENAPDETIDIRKCGNGIVEEGEDCDCGALGCITHDCCDVRTCKFRRNAVCASGSCCNLSTCNISDSTRVCSGPKRTCDLPEFCDGITVECPDDAHLPNGEKCPDDDDAICYGGRCGSRMLQCKDIWGEDSVPSPDTCYERNSLPKGCGFPTNDSDMRCAPENILCGRLQCQVLNQTFSEKYKDVFHHWFRWDDCHSILAYYQEEYDYQLGMTPNGASCGQGKYCLKGKCLPDAELLLNSSKK